MLRSVLLATVFTTIATTQHGGAGIPTDPPAAVRHLKLGPGESATDGKGRVVENQGTNRNGGVVVAFTGKAQRDSNGNYTVEDIVEITNPASQGSAGPVRVDTGGEPTTINLDRSGTDPGGHVQATIMGGHATVNVSGNWNDPSVMQTENVVIITGNNCSGRGVGANSGGTVNLGGRGSTWASGGGNWLVGS